MDEVVLSLRVERVGLREVGECGEDLDELPRIGHVDPVEVDRRVWRDLQDVVAQQPGERDMAGLMEELESVYDEVIVLEDGHCRPPLLPSSGRLSSVERGTDETDDDGRLVHGYLTG